MVDVIGAGFGRTGTASLKRALELLGFGPAHHMSEVLKRPDTAGGWARALLGDTALLPGLLDGYRASLDFPSCLLWRELVLLYPHAKVVLTVREPAAWYRSARATILRQDTESRRERLAAVGGASLVEVLAPLSAAMAERGFRRDLSEGDTIAGFLRHNEAVLAGVPAQRLLVYEVEHGWAPLCAFLGVDVPDLPFPRGNDAAAFQQNVEQAVRSGADFD